MPTPHLQLRILRDDAIPAFGGFHRCDDPTCPMQNTVLLNVEACFSPELVDADGAPIPQTAAESKAVILETLMHEFGHALEAFFGEPVNEEAIEAAIDSFRAKQSAH